MSYPTVAGVVAHLRESGHPTMADVVERLEESEKLARQAADASVRAYYALRDKHEPRPKAESFVNWTGD